MARTEEPIPTEAALALDSLLDPAMPDAQRRIVTAALLAFAERGYNGTTTSEIAREAGVAEGTVFRYYRTKKELLLNAVGPLFLRVILPIVRRNLDQILTAEYASFENLLYALLRDRLAFARSHAALVRVVVQEIPFHPELREQFKSIVFDKLYPFALAAIEKYQERGEITAIPPITVARIVGSVFVGYVFTRVFIAPEAQWDDETEIRTMIDTLMHGLAPQRA